MKSETEITKGTRRTTLSLSDELTYCNTRDNETTEEIQIPPVPSDNDQIPTVSQEEGGDLEDLKSPVSEASSSSGSYSVTTENGRGEGRRNI